jgi:hypothetical protein
MKSMVTDRDGTGAVRRRLVAMVIVVGGLLALVLSSPTAVAQAPSLAITSPAANAIIGNGSPVIVTFLLSNFTLVQPGRVGQVVGPDEGHLDVFVDDTYAGLVTRVEPISLALDSGPHTIRLQLKRNDRMPLVPDVSASVSVVVTHGPAVGTPTIDIAYPANLMSSGHDVYVAVVVSNFTLVDPNGRPNAPNEGHLQVLLQGVYQEELSRYEPAFIVDMPDGDNTITVRLVNNDGTPLSPDASASTTIYVKPATATLPEILNFGVTVLLVYILIVLVLRRRKAAAKLAPSRDENP